MKSGILLIYSIKSLYCWYVWESLLQPFQQNLSHPSFLSCLPYNVFVFPSAPGCCWTFPAHSKNIKAVLHLPWRHYTEQPAVSTHRLWLWPSASQSLLQPGNNPSKGGFFFFWPKIPIVFFFNGLSIKMTHECGCSSGWQFYFLCLVLECSFDFIRKRHLPLKRPTHACQKLFWEFHSFSYLVSCQTTTHHLSSPPRCLGSVPLSAVICLRVNSLHWKRVAIEGSQSSSRALILSVYQARESKWGSGYHLT